MENQALQDDATCVDFPTREFLTRTETAEFLTEQGFPTPKGTLQKLASVGGGPPYSIYGNKALYRPPEALAWARSRLSAPKFSTSE